MCVKINDQRYRHALRYVKIDNPAVSLGADHDYFCRFHKAAVYTRTLDSNGLLHQFEQYCTEKFDALRDDSWERESNTWLLFTMLLQYASIAIGIFSNGRL